MATEISIEYRRKEEAELLSVKGFMSLAEVVEKMGISESTARRDLEILEDQGLIRRTHGGAVYVKDTAAYHYGHADRETSAAEEKRTIALSVAELIDDEQTVILDGGTTCFQIALAIVGRRLNVITNSVHIASVLSSDLATEVTLIGGYVYPRTGVALGSTAAVQLAGLHAGRAIISCAGLGADGAYNANQMMVDAESLMMDSADEIILAVDHTKLDRRAVVKLCDLDAIDIIVTDDGASSESRNWLNASKAKVIYA